MWGAIIGDLAGSVYEYDQTKHFTKLNPTELIKAKSFYSDDTILTIAILEAILNNKDYEYYLKKYTKDFLTYKPDFIPYFKSPFSPSFVKWALANEKGTSIGNGAMMRISAVGYLFNNKQDIINNVRLATEPSHNSLEAINSATTVALIIFLARLGYSKEEIIKELNIKLNYKDFNSFNDTCSKTIDNCLYALFTSSSFEESLLKVISFGGDTDTNACIVGSMAEALYGIPDELIEEAKKKIPTNFNTLLDKGYAKILKCSKSR